MDYFELIETFPKPGCAVCNLLRVDVERCVDGMVYGFMDTDEMRAAFSAARGLCGEHGWMLKQNKFGNVLGIAKLYAATLGEVLAIIDSTPIQSAPAQSRIERLIIGERRSGAAPLADELEPAAGCMVCERIDEREAVYAAMFDRFRLDERFRTAFDQSDGLCLPHFRTILRALTDPARVDAVIKIQSRIWADLKAQVEAFAAKQNYERIDDLTEAEGASWVQAIADMSGARDIFGIRRKSG
jgi:hypothetical protein